MIYLLNPRLWIAAIVLTALAASHFSAFRVGKNQVQAEWDRYIAEQHRRVAEAEQSARQIERRLVLARDKAEKTYVEQKRRAAADAATTDLQLARLRDELAARDRLAAQLAASTPGVDGGVAAERELFGKCAEALVQLAREADELQVKVNGLQGYVKSITQEQ